MSTPPHMYAGTIGSGEHIEGLGIPRDGGTWNRGVKGAPGAAQAMEVSASCHGAPLPEL